MILHDGGRSTEEDKRRRVSIRDVCSVWVMARKNAGGTPALPAVKDR
jgi:hypothetical protein